MDLRNALARGCPMLTAHSAKAYKPPAHTQPTPHPPNTAQPHKNKSTPRRLIFARALTFVARAPLTKARLNIDSHATVVRGFRDPAPRGAGDRTVGKTEQRTTVYQIGDGRVAEIPGQQVFRWYYLPGS